MAFWSPHHHSAVAVTQMLSLSHFSLCVPSLLLSLLHHLLNLYSNDPRACKLFRLLGPHPTLLVVWAVAQEVTYLKSIPGESWEDGDVLLFLSPFQELANFSSKGPE